MGQPLLGAWIIAMRRILLSLHMKQVLELTKRLVDLIKLCVLDITAFKILINRHLILSLNKAIKSAF